MVLNLTVGGLAANAAATPSFRGGALADLIVSEFNERYYEMTYNKAGFYAANPTGVTSTAFVSGTTTVFLGICLTNPIGSGVNLVLNKVGVTCTVAPASESVVVLATGFNAGTPVTQTTALTVGSTLIGSGAGALGLVSSSFTVPTAPTTNMILGNIGTGAATVSIVTPSLFDLEGCRILAPGGYALLTMLVASGASGFFGSFSWSEKKL